jgi:(p)ppGpp synthase/HD superfamily hydrolase
MIDQAIKLAAEVHEGQVDKGGEPYILHVLAVMEICRQNYRGFNKQEVLVTAILHDTLEDFDAEKAGFPINKLWDEIKLTFGECVLTALEALTRPMGYPYADYIENIAQTNWIAREVKIADLTHNMDVTRLPEGEIGELDFKRWDKYRKALVRLKREVN